MERIVGNISRNGKLNRPCVIAIRVEINILLEWMYKNISRNYVKDKCRWISMTMNKYNVHNCFGTILKLQLYFSDKILLL